MASNTPNLGLRKPTVNDRVNIALDIAGNMDLIDTAVNSKAATGHTHSGTYVATAGGSEIRPASGETAITLKARDDGAIVAKWDTDSVDYQSTLNLYPPGDDRRAKVSYWSKPAGVAGIARPLSIEAHGRSDTAHAPQNHVTFYSEDSVGTYHHVLHWKWGQDWDGLVYVGGASEGGDGEMNGLVVSDYEGVIGVGTITPAPTVAGRPVIQVDGSNASGLTAEIRNTVASVQARWRTNTSNSGLGTDSAHDMLLFARGGSNTLLTLSTSTITVADAKDIALATGTGTKIGTATGQKLGFWNATPVIQPVSGDQLRTALQNVGLLPSGGVNLLNAVDADIAAGAAIAKSKLASLAIADADVSASAAISDYKLADPDVLTTGEATMRRRFVSATNVSLGASGTMRLAYFTARKTETITQMRLISGGTAAGATPTLVRAGIYSIDGSGNLTLVASIANDTTIFATGSTAYTRSLSGGNFSKVAGTRYAVGVLVVTGAALPTMTGANGLIATEAGQAPRVSATIGSQTDLPGSVAVGSLGDTGNVVYTALVP